MVPNMLSAKMLNLSLPNVESRNKWWNEPSFTNSIDLTVKLSTAQSDIGVMSLGCFVTPGDM